MDQALLFGQFDILDVCRRAQGDLYASLGFGPVESSHHVIASAPFWRLRDYGASSGSASVLIVAAPIKRPYIWDLAPPVSAIRRCLDADLRVLLLEWLPASEATCNIGITECVQAASEAVKRIGSSESERKPILMGHSLGGTLAAIYAASAPNAVDGLILLSTPLCFREGESLFRDALVSLVPNPVSDARIYPGSVLSQASAAASPVTFIWSRYLDAITCATDRAAMDIHARVQRWAFDEVALPGKLVSEIVEWLYRENRFHRAILNVEGRMIGCKDLSTPTLAVVNTADPVAPVNSVRPIGETLGPEEFQLIEYPGERGICLQHLGVLVGRQAHAWLWPQIVDWIRTRTRWARHPDGVAAE
ncbi:alpha/beta fold hydrolase [Bradyrhizobium sp.]|uniref:alpha/beta fold hydrolase n=1 Tax=Bradyrhizobium sp. TaxID=376 RepID=UPI002D467F9A|nr:alpha/beta fold hydrolase [Bradyrhizobium sp.]HZR77501.1 alpha/beta fold hydrolase [Bradyrhizobium sp.]